MTSWGLEARQNSSASGNTGDKGGPGSLIKEVLLRGSYRSSQSITKSFAMISNCLSEVIWQLSNVTSDHAGPRKSLYESLQHAHRGIGFA